MIKLLELFSDLVASLSERSELFFVASDDFGWVVETEMQPMPDLPGEDRTCFIRIIANGDDIIELLMEILLNTFWFLR